MRQGGYERRNRVFAIRLFSDSGFVNESLKDITIHGMKVAGRRHAVRRISVGSFVTALDFLVIGLGLGLLIEIVHDISSSFLFLGR